MSGRLLQRGRIAWTRMLTTTMNNILPLALGQFPGHAQKPDRNIEERETAVQADGRFDVTSGPPRMRFRCYEWTYAPSRMPVSSRQSLAAVVVQRVIHTG